METVTTRLSEPELTLLDRLVQLRGTSRSDILGDAVRSHVREQLVDIALARYHQGTVGMRGAAEIAGLPIHQMVAVAADRDVASNLDATELDRASQDLRTHGRKLIDADVFIRLAEVGGVELLDSLPGDVWLPVPVDQEITGHPPATAVETAVSTGWVGIAAPPPAQSIQQAAQYLGRDLTTGTYHGDVLLLAHALAGPDTLVLTDDRPLRDACRRLSVPVAGSVGLVVWAVQAGALDPGTGTATLHALDTVGPQLTPAIRRRAEQLIGGAPAEPATGSSTE